MKAPPPGTQSTSPRSTSKQASSPGGGGGGGGSQRVTSIDISVGSPVEMSPSSGSAGSCEGTSTTMPSTRVMVTKAWLATIVGAGKAAWSIFAVMMMSM